MYINLPDKMDGIKRNWGRFTTNPHLFMEECQWMEVQLGHSSYEKQEQEDAGKKMQKAIPLKENINVPHEGWISKPTGKKTTVF